MKILIYVNSNRDLKVHKLGGIEILELLAI